MLSLNPGNRGKIRRFVRLQSREPSTLRQFAQSNCRVLYEIAQSALDSSLVLVRTPLLLSTPYRPRTTMANPLWQLQMSSSFVMRYADTAPVVRPRRRAEPYSPRRFQMPYRLLR